MPLDFNSQVEVVAYLRESCEDCRGLSGSCRGRGSILDAQYLAGRADAFSLAAALIEALPSFKGEKTGAGPSAPVPEEKTKRSRRKRDPAADDRRRASAAEATEKTRAAIHAALCEDDIAVVRLDPGVIPAIHQVLEEDLL